jgi:hypothetical protein
MWTRSALAKRHCHAYKLINIMIFTYFLADYQKTGQPPVNDRPVKLLLVLL